MSQFPQSQRRSWGLEYGTDNKVVFNFFNAVYAWMAVGLAVTAAVAWFVSQSSVALHLIFGTPLRWALILGSVAIAWGVGSVALRISAAAATALFLVYSALVGAMISYIFLIYPTTTLVSALVVTGGTFGGMSLYGYVTKSRSVPLPVGLKVFYRSDNDRVVKVSGSTLKTVGRGIATVTATVHSHDGAASTGFTVDVDPFVGHPGP